MLRSSINFSTAEKDSSHAASFRAHANSDSTHCGGNYDGSQPLRTYIEPYTVPYLPVEFNFGKSFKTSGATLSNASIWKNDSAPMRLAPMDVTSSAASLTILENLNAPMPSTPSTEPWRFGKRKGCANLFPFEHPGCWRQTGLVNFDSSSPPTSTTPSPTTPHYRPLPTASSSPNTPPWWTAYVTTRKRLHAGQMAKHPNVRAPIFDNTPATFHHRTNTLLSMATLWRSKKHLSHLLQLAHFRTRSSRHPAKSTPPCAQPYGHGRLGTHYLQSPSRSSTTSGKSLFTNTTL